MSVVVEGVYAAKARFKRKASSNEPALPACRVHSSHSHTTVSAAHEPCMARNIWTHNMPVSQGSREDGANAGLPGKTQIHEHFNQQPKRRESEVSADLDLGHAASVVGRERGCRNLHLAVIWHTGRSLPLLAAGSARLAICNLYPRDASKRIFSAKVASLARTTAVCMMSPPISTT